jgi:DNA-binding transcriptional LysR family regulator
MELTTRHPELSIELLGGNKVLALARGDAELALRTVAIREDGVRMRKLMGMPVALYASADYRRRRGAPSSLDSLGRDGHDVLVPCAELARLPEARVLERAVAAGARPVLRSNSMSALVDAARAGAGIVPIVATWADIAQLDRVLALPDVAPRPLWLAVGPGQRDRAAVRVVADEVARLASHHT